MDQSTAPDHVSDSWKIFWQKKKKKKSAMLAMDAHTPTEEFSPETQHVIFTENTRQIDRNKMSASDAFANVSTPSPKNYKKLTEILTKMVIKLKKSMHFRACYY